MKSKQDLNKLLSLVLLGLLLNACSPFYVMRAAYEETKILLGREDISGIITKNNLSLEKKDKLQLVLEARDFAIQMGLHPKDSFTQYSEVKRDPLVWVLLASKPDAFEVYTWWYPIVGDVPYKGFFDQKDAIDDAKDLKDKGYEIWIRGSEAFSTLGWFADPVLSTTLKHPRTRIANTVLHESFHSTIWFPGQVAFNESAANFVGIQGTLDFFKNKYKHCMNKSSKNCLQQKKEFNAVIETFIYQLELSEVLTALYDELESLYSSQETKEEKLSKRNIVFNKYIQPFKKRYPKMKILKKINNAEIMQLKLYLTKLDGFVMLFEQNDNNWQAFISAIEEIKIQHTENKETELFDYLPVMTN